MVKDNLFTIEPSEEFIEPSKDITSDESRYFLVEMASRAKVTWFFDTEEGTEIDMTINPETRQIRVISKYKRKDEATTKT